MWKRLRQHPLGRYLPLLVLAALGAFLYKSSLFPQERKIVWETGGSRSEIRQVELQLWTSGGELLNREELSFPFGPGPEIVQKISLREGSYDARFVIDRGPAPREAGTRALEIGGAETYRVPLGRE